jgi:hypothetical protein
VHNEALETRIVQLSNHPYLFALLNGERALPLPPIESEIVDAVFQSEKSIRGERACGKLQGMVEQVRQNLEKANDQPDTKKRRRKSRL